MSFQLRGVGTNRFAELTKKYTNPGLPTEAKLAILLNDEITTAPNLKSAITGGMGRITGSFKVEETQRIAGVLNSGKLPASLNKVPVQEETISAQLGTDTIRSGAIAMAIATASVLLFMWMFYGFCGIVADLCVLLNVLLVMAFMIPLKAALTLSGLAGLVLSVGMAVDANVLIFERMREEVARGSALKMAIRNGFSRAMSTVIDSNLTTLISGVVLFAIGSDQLKGFATTLILGLLLNLFTAVYCSRIIFNIAERRGWFTKLNMMRLVGETKFDFVGPVKYCVIGSVLIIAAGLAVGVSRGKNFFDIDFVGGSTVQIVMTEAAAAQEKPDVATIRRDIGGRLPDLEVSEVTNTAGDKRPQFKVVTSENNLTDAKRILTEIFGDKLQHYEMTYANVGPYVPKKPKTPVVPAAKTDPKKAEEKKSDEKKSEPVKSDEKKSDTDLKTSDTTKTEPAKTVPSKSETPAAPAKEEPAAPTPEKAAPAETKDGATKDAEKKQSGLDRELRSLGLAWRSIVSGTLTHGLLLQDDKAAPKTESPSTDSAKSEAKSESSKSEPTTTKKADPAKSEPAASESTKSGETKVAESNVVDPTKSLPTAPSTEALLDSTRYRSQADLNFSIRVSYQYLLGVTTDVLTAKKINVTDFNFVHPEGNTASTAVSEKWTLVSSSTPAELETIVKDLQASIVSQPAFSQVSNVGSAVADNSKYNAIWALLVSLAAIVVYVWFRFQNVVFGFAAVIALVHDVLFTVGALAVSVYLAPYMGWAMVDPFKISLEVVAALLTIIGFSINDTIVIFDRIREIKGKSPDITEDMVNRAVNQTLGRTILTSGTVLIVTIILYVFGGEEIHPFSFAMLVGLISGTYSTVYIAAPIILWFRKKKPVATPVVRTPAVLGRGR
ncbi:MAG: protein translocase subunit SecD [Pirellulales bacterium]